MQTITATKARQKFFRLQDIIFNDSEEINIEFKTGSAVLLNKVDYDNMLENLYIATSSQTMSRIKNFDNEKKSRYNSLKDLENALENRNLG